MIRHSAEEILEHSPRATQDIDEIDPIRVLREENASLGLQIKEMEEAMTRLRGIQAHNNSRMNHIRDPLARLPVELVSIIFKLVRPPPLSASYHLDFSKPDEISEGMMSPLLLCSVCQAWRAIALSTPNLWKTIFINIYNRNDTDIIRQWLTRSGRHSTSIYLFASRKRDRHENALSFPLEIKGHVKRLMGVVNEFSKRCLYLNLDIPKRFMKYACFTGSRVPNLQMLTLRDSERPYDGPEVKLEKSSRLSNVRLYGVKFDDVKLDWKTIIHAKCFSLTTLSHTRELVRRAPFLKHLVVEEPWEETFNVVPTLLQQNHLTYLDLTLCPQDVVEVSLLSCLILPALIHLGISTESTGKADLDPVHAFLERSSCTLKTFRFEFKSVIEDVTTLIALLKKIPSLETLDLEYRDCEREWSTSSPFLLPSPATLQEIDAIDENRFLPNLKEISVVIDCHPGIFFVELDLRPASPPSSGPIRLKPLHIYHLVDPDILRKLQLPIVGSDIENIEPPVESVLSFQNFFQRTLRKNEYEVDLNQ